ncbi:hypothetical protein ACFOZ0_30320 [Streptomyces yaanensis]|uniref:Uncharacterized protein n=1 Tax=Streptomyces yaanensis TaxID=1142239 RepID=A0ABV7SKP5_9ACTN|nr:hypothetical protein [Streptomyces sp. CGMCC 4.7035]WNC00376.1 hypothetical protein Q2K21_21225 [Streptomyces sp. CGMCC 4.7035]
MATSAPRTCECAWYGDPAFDIAFVVNHLVLKTLVVARRRHALLPSAHALVDAYARHVTWEAVDDTLARAAKLLPTLLLARVDGLSPVEYLDTTQQGPYERSPGNFSVPRARICIPS